MAQPVPPPLLALPNDVTILVPEGVVSFIQYCQEESVSVSLQNVTELTVYNVALGGIERIFDTVPHRQLIKKLLTIIRHLGGGNYVRKQGLSCSLFVGSRGIGKTYCLKMMAVLTRYIVPRVHVFYVNFNSVGQANSPFVSQSLCTYLAWKLRRDDHALKFDQQLNVPICEQLVTRLRDRGEYLLLILDDVEALYRLDGNDHKAVISTLHELSFFGDDGSGRVSVVLCGSTCVTQRLISARHVDPKFRLLSTGAIDLNLSKYPAVHFPSVLPTDLSAVASILNVPIPDTADGNENIDKPWIRMVAYFSGCNPRAAERIGGDDMIGEEPKPEPLGDEVQGSRANNALLLKNEVMKCMVVKNLGLLREIFGKGDLGAVQVSKNLASTRWETRLLPVEYSIVVDCWQKLIDNKKIPRVFDDDLAQHMITLIDSGWLTCTSCTHNGFTDIYPCSFKLLADVYLRHESALHVSAQMMRTMQEGRNGCLNRIMSNQAVGNLIRVAPCFVGLAIMASPGGCNLS